MKKYSASYTNLDTNFCIETSNLQKINNCQNNQALVSITRNIINRSSLTKPSDFLIQNLGKNKIYPVPVTSSEKYNLIWEQTIKGGNDSNPAYYFYIEYLPKLLNNNYILYNSFIPEIPLKDVIISKKDDIVDNYLDFYSPKLKLAIEIDGIQHKKTKLEDKERDILLKTNGITLVRIPTHDISKPNKKISNIVDSYIPQTDIKCIDKEIYNYNACIRYEMMLLQLLEANIISLENKEWKFNIIQNAVIDKNAINIAIEEVLTCINNIRILQNKKTFNINTTTSFFNKYIDDCINIDLDIFKKYDETLTQNFVYIRNDYFDYSLNANINDEKHRFNKYKNYYKVSNGTINYDIELTDSNTHNALLYFLKMIFGFKSFLNNQEEIIVECLNKGNVIGLLPTGAGKSLCYQFSSFLLPGTTLVISPLKILMKDQCDNLLKRNRINNITYINSSNKFGMYLFENNQTKITIISPERFFDETFIKIIKQDNIQINLITLDEVHCLSEWGHDFRTSYLCLMYYFKKNISNKCRLLGLTATASPRVCEDIKIEFNSFKKNTKLIQADSLERENLNIYISRFEKIGIQYDYNNKYKYLAQLYKNDFELDKKTIVFTKTKSKNLTAYDSCYNLAQQLKLDKGIKNNLIDYFASSGEEKDKEDNNEKLENFKNGKTKLLFATKAFGMGIDIPDIRRTIHYELPSSIESLYQEFGRAGRDGKKSDCLIWYYKENKEYLDELLKSDMTIDSISKNKNKFNEFHTNLYFLVNLNLDISKEIFFENYILNYLRNIKTKEKEFYAQTLIDDFNTKYFDKIIENDKITYIPKEKYEEFLSEECNYKEYIEKALYRLYLLGKISMWSIKYSYDLNNPLYTHIEITNNSIEEQINKLEKYIQRYEPLYKYNKKKTTQENDLIEELIKWTFKHFVYQRLQSMKNLYECCENYQDSKSFMKNIVNFLYNDQSYSVLINKPNNYKMWFKIINNTPIEELTNIIARYLENDDKIVSLNFISGYIRLITNDYSNVDGERRMKMAFETIKTYDNNQIDDIIRITLNTEISNDKKDKLVSTMLQVNENWYTKIYKTYQNEELENYIFINLAQDIAKIGEKINDRLR